MLAERFSRAVYYKRKVPNCFGTLLSSRFLKSKDHLFLAAFLGAAFEELLEEPFDPPLEDDPFEEPLDAAFFAVAIFLEFNC